MAVAVALALRVPLPPRPPGVAVGQLVVVAAPAAWPPPLAVPHLERVGSKGDGEGE